MRRLARALFRFSRAAVVLLPIYLTYIWIWLWYLRGRRPVDWEWLERVHERNARAFYELAVELRGGLIKAGQMISARVDIVPAAWCRELQRLQDRVEPAPWDLIEAHLRREYGRPLHELFRELDREATAAASFGQVHRARTRDGKLVALKVRYPDIAEKLDVDLLLMGIATPLFNVFVPKVPLRTVYAEMRAALLRELDYEQEAEFTRTIHRNLAPLEQVFVPNVIDELSTKTVICTEFFDGFRINDLARMQQLGIAPRTLLDLVLQAWTKMIYEDGVFQSDPHPGNLLFNVRNGRAQLCILDFGQVKVLPSDFHDMLTRCVVAFMQKDVGAFLATIVELEMLSAADAEKARPFLTDFFGNYFHLTPAAARKLDIEHVRKDLKGLLGKIEGVNIPNDVVLHARAISLLAGLASSLDDSANLFMLAQPHILRTMLKLQAKKALAAARAA